jgi:PAS domain S-box-containing protein
MTAPVAPIQSSFKKVEISQRLLWYSLLFVTLILGIAFFLVPTLIEHAGDFKVVRFALGSLLGMVFLLNVVTIYQQLKIQRVRQDLAQREEIFRLISENAADMIALVDGSGRRLYNSPSYERILGYTAEELQSTSAFEQIHPDDRQLVQEAAKEAQRGGEPRSIVYRMRRKDGTWRVFESTANTIRNSEGKVEKLVIVNRDITDRQHLEEQFRQAQKMEAVGRLSGGIAHDFNNLLSVIIGYSESVQEQLPEASSLHRSVGEILKAGERAASLTRQLLAFSRQQVLSPKVLDLNAIVTDMEKMLRRVIGEDIELSTKLDPALGRLKADQSQIEQIVMNLAVNARDAMPHGGKLFVQSENIVMDEDFVRRYSYPVQTGAYVCLTVADTGVGMDALTKARVFEPFFTTKEKGKGTGLGLSTVYGVVKQTGGYIDIESSLGEGTSFKIYLPRVDAAVTIEKPRVESPASLKGNETILLVEDEASLRTLTRTSLEACGYTILEASDGADALEVSRQHPKPIDLVLTDIVMPGMGGNALGQQLSQERPGIQIVYMSGYTPFESQAAIGAESFFLMKPFTRDALRQKIHEALKNCVTAGAASEGSRRAASLARAASTPKILVVDDDEEIVSLFRARLADSFEVIATGDSEEAIALSLKHKPDCILVDLSLPKVGGLELCRTLKSLSTTSPIPIFVISGEPASAYRDLCLNNGATEYLEKPLNFTMLRTRLSQISNTQRRERRYQARARLSLTLKLKVIDEKGTALEFVTATEDVSARGFLCPCPGNLAPDTIVDVFVVTAGLEREAGRARVAHVKWPGTPAQRFGFQFLEEPRGWIPAWDSRDSVAEEQHFGFVTAKND